LAFDVIRVANLVQRVYFDDDTLRKIVINLRDRLRDGGILIICRTTENGVNHATIFRRTGDCFVFDASINDGAEVRDLVLALSCQ
jgi:chemotaxis methyl-accepting protein methylase